MDPVSSMVEDKVLIETIISDNEHWNNRGISDKDIEVCFEMSFECDWGISFSKARFREALDNTTGVICVNERWFPAGSPNIRKLGERRSCAGPRCTVDISHLRADARFCSTKCQVASHRRQTV